MPVAQPHFICIGGALIDRKYVLHGPLLAGTSNPGTVSITFGGVARNIAENLARLGNKVALAAAIGADSGGAALRADLISLGVDTTALILMPDHPTAEYAAILQAGNRELALAVVAMDAAEHAIEHGLNALMAQIPAETIVFADANLSQAALQILLAAQQRVGFRLALDAVSISKAQRLPHRLDGVDLIFMNTDEAQSYLGTTAKPADLARYLTERGANRAIVTAGANGAYFHDGAIGNQCDGIDAQVADVTGAGDSLIAATLWRIAQGDTLGSAIGWGILAAGLTVESTKSVRPDLSADFLIANRWRIALP